MKTVAVVAMSVLLLAGCSSAPETPAVPPAPSPSVIAEEDFSGLPVEVPGNGSFVAGVDMQPGFYGEETPQPNCGWSLGLDGELLGSGTGDVKVNAGETLEVSGCSVWVKFD